MSDLYDSDNRSMPPIYQRMLRLLVPAAFALMIGLSVWMPDPFLMNVVGHSLVLAASGEAAKILEPVVAMPAGQQDLETGTAPTRIWRSRTWCAIKLSSVAIDAAVVKFVPADPGPYLVMLAFAILYTGRVAATAARYNRPDIGIWQRITYAVAKEFLPLVWIGNPYRVPVSLLAALLAMMWTLYRVITWGFEQAMPLFIVWAASAPKNSETSFHHLIKRFSGSDTGSQWGPNLVGSGLEIVAAFVIYKLTVPSSTSNENEDRDADTDQRANGSPASNTTVPEDRVEGTAADPLPPTDQAESSSN